MHVFPAFALVALAHTLSIRQAQPKEPTAILEHDADQPTALFLHLPYATYRGHLHAPSNTYIFKNIRYAAPPLGPLRWKKPLPPVSEEGTQDTPGPIACTQPVQSNVRTADQIVVGPGREDCLYLDLTVPAKVIKQPDAKLPVLVWIHGGYYTVGSKDERTFHQFAKPSNGSMIAVAPNYRVGMYGFFAGDTFEKDGTPNVGLWDQRAALQWVQTYIPSLGGDADQVTAMGISAGAGSIMHHMTAESGASDPLFKRGILQSAGYATVTDRAEPEKTYKELEERGGCAGKGVECMRGLSEAKLRELSDWKGSKFQPGASGWDPIPDGKYVVNTPTVEIANGRDFCETVVRD